MLADDIAAALAGGGGLSAAELAHRLGTPENGVSFALFAGHTRFRCDLGSPARWWLASAAPARAPARAASPAGPSPAATIQAPAPASPPPERSVASLRLYSWQAEALAAWEAQGRRGVVEAVTGAGKTTVGVAAALDELGRRGQVVVLVPTVELQHQWLAELEPRLPRPYRVGRMGAGACDSLSTHDVLVAVVNSARATDVRPIRKGGLLVADECHRYGSAINQLALDPRFAHRLGLSATYARDDGGNAAWLDPYFGPACFRLGYDRAVADGVVARFTVTLVGARFTPGEQARYDELSQLMRSLRARLVRDHRVPDEPFEAWLKALAAVAAGDGEASTLARSYRQAMLERRRLLADTPTKDGALRRLAPALARAERTMVFTQSIATAERVCSVLVGSGFRASALHSGLDGRARAETLRRFAAGDLDVVVAPRVLDEGIDVPAADLAVIVGASRTRRQMVQRMGRVLRRKPDGRRARFAVLFIEGSVEDPRSGAHEAFIGDVTGVADEISYVPADSRAAGSLAPVG